MRRVKRCSSCDALLPLSSFRADPRATSGLQSQCKQCQSNRRRELRQAKRGVATIPYMPMSKVCPACDAPLPRDDFARNAASRDGLQTYCRACHHARYPDTRVNRERPGRFRKNQRWREIQKDGADD